MNFLNLIRYKNLLLIALIQGFIKYGLLDPWGVKVALDDFKFGLLVIATCCIAAAGNVINDIYDVAIDTINKPQKVIVGRKISEKTANRIYFTLNILGVGLAFYLSNSIGKPGFSGFFIIISALLYLYASNLKGVLLIGNLLVSLIVAFSILIVGIFDILPAMDTDEMSRQMIALQVILHYAFFAFFINFIREIVKDIEDINGDKNGNMNTLPIALGRKRATNIVLFLSIMLTLTVLGYIYFYLYHSQPMVLYFLFLIVAPLLYFCIKSRNAEMAKDYAMLSFLLKVIMFLGICSIWLYPMIEV